jgi:hypothetical protein
VDHELGRLMADLKPTYVGSNDGTVTFEFSDEQIDRFVAFIMGTEPRDDSRK